MDDSCIPFNAVKAAVIFILLAFSLIIISCGNESQINFCNGVIISVAGRAEDDLYIKSSFNNWSFSTPMTYKDGIWSVELFLAPGSYPYEFFSAKTSKRFLDNANPLTMFDKDIRYSKLVVKDCRYPTVELAGRPEINGKNIKFQIKFTPGISGKNPDFNKSEILLGRETADYSFDKKTGIISIDYEAKDFDKFTWFFRIFDSDGFAAEVLTVPVWIEKKEFDWTENAFIYQLMTDRFSNGDKSNDDPLPAIDEKANWQGGDFQGIIDKIDDNYFTDMGVNVLWISSPVANTENPGKGMGGDTRYYAPYHSYWPVATGWTNELHLPGLDSPIEKHFGSEEKLHELIQKAHKKGIRIMFDFVPNHVHTDSYLWKTYKNRGWFNMAEKGFPKNSNGGYTCGWEKPVECWFTDYLADINYENNDATEAVINHLIWMIQEFDIDGLRLDAIRLMKIDFTSSLKTAIQRKVTTTGILFYMIGETFTGDMGWKEIGDYLGESKLDGQFDFPLYHHIVRTFLLQSETIETFAEFLKTNDYRYQNDFYKGSIMGNFIGNHDVARALSLANKDFDGVSSQGGAEADQKVWENSPELPEEELPFKKMRNALTFMFTHPGIPIIYQGDEFGMPGANDPDNRRMALFGDDLSENQKKNLEHTQILGKFRKGHPALAKGIRKNLIVKENIYAFAMKHEKETVIAVFNNGEESEKVTIDLDEAGFKGEAATLFSEEKTETKKNKITFELEPFSSELIYGRNDTI
ncbi:alpha-glucosidase C-terminal domain-containing protein [bacterium]|nr:alpha-glucosidase C-terminal domain-containing protein [bacterium]